jgi:hypothetical protein
VRISGPVALSHSGLARWTPANDAANTQDSDRVRTLTTSDADEVTLFQFRWVGVWIWGSVFIESTMPRTADPPYFYISDWISIVSSPFVRLEITFLGEIRHHSGPFRGHLGGFKWLRCAAWVFVAQAL